MSYYPADLSDLGKSASILSVAQLILCFNCSFKRPQSEKHV